MRFAVLTALLCAGILAAIGFMRISSTGDRASFAANEGEDTVAAVAGAAENSAAEGNENMLSGAWQIDALNGEATHIGMRGTYPELQFEAGKVNGQSGCNGFGGAIEQNAGGKVKFGAMMATQMACSEQLMRQEHEIYGALEEAVSYSFGDVSEAHDTGGSQIAAQKLNLLNAEGKTVLELTRKQVEQAE